MGYMTDSEKALVKELQEQYYTLRYNRRRRLDGREQLGIFVNDVDEDVNRIEALMDSLVNVLKYNMPHDDFDAWLMQSADDDSTLDENALLVRENVKLTIEITELGKQLEAQRLQLNTIKKHIANFEMCYGDPAKLEPCSDYGN